MFTFSEKGQRMIEAVEKKGASLFNKGVADFDEEDDNVTSEEEDRDNV